MTETDRLCAIALALCPGLARRTLNRMVQELGSPTAVWEGDDGTLQQVCRLRPQTLATLSRWRRAKDPAQLVEVLSQMGITPVVREDALYPQQLSAWERDSPLVLFGKGRMELLRDIPLVSVVGTRRASAYGLEAVRWVSDSLVQGGCAIVSGMALGIDAAAHQAALDAHGATIAVLGTGVNVCYPSSHQTLYQRIVDEGLVLSEYPPNATANKFHFPERNRIIAALGSVLVVAQAGERSGALGTVDAALHLGKDVYVVPGPITSKLYRGSNRLLKDGAQPLVDPVDLLADLQLALAPVEERLPPRWQELYEALDTVRSAQELAHIVGLPMQVVYSALLELELSGWVQHNPGALYSRSGVHR